MGPYVPGFRILDSPDALAAAARAGRSRPTLCSSAPIVACLHPPNSQRPCDLRSCIPDPTRPTHEGISPIAYPPAPLLQQFIPRALNWGVGVRVRGTRPNLGGNTTDETPYFSGYVELWSGFAVSSDGTKLRS